MNLIPLFGDKTIWYTQFEYIFKELARHFVDSTSSKEKDQWVTLNGLWHAKTFKKVAVLQTQDYYEANLP